MQREIIEKQIRNLFHLSDLTLEEKKLGCWKCPLKKIRTEKQLVSDCRICKSGGIVMCFYAAKYITRAKIGGAYYEKKCNVKLDC